MARNRSAVLFLPFLALTLLVFAVGCSSSPDARRPGDPFSPGARVVLNAHNCYPEAGKYQDRIDRAIASGLPVAIEQDIAWHRDPETGRGWSVLSHETHTSGTEPTLESHFFETVRPIVEKELSEGSAESWPVVYLHFNFKTNEREHVEYVQALLLKYRDWLSSAVRQEDNRKLSKIDYKPILVMTETDPTERAVFHDEIPVGERFYVFGSAPTESQMPRGLSRQEQWRYMVSTPPEQLISTPADNYRRWWNNSWFIVEEGGAPRAGDWTPADRDRLRALVQHAHRLGYMIRFYTLNGHEPDAGQGWGTSYNFGSIDAARIRWKASAEAGVDFIATDQYEEVAAELRALRGN